MPRQGRDRNAYSVSKADARSFARRYVELTDALVHEGVPEDVARNEARMAAITLLLELDGVGGDLCPMCGRPKPV